MVATKIKSEMVNDDGVPYKKLTGGKVYIAGSANVYGKLHASFTLVEKVKDLNITQVSAGFRHCAMVSADGELFTWGHNYGGCLGLPESNAFVTEPTLIKAMHSNAGKHYLPTYLPISPSLS